MKTIYLLIHKSTYGSERKVLRAYENELEAQDAITVFDGIVTGSLEIQPVAFVGTAKLPEGWRPSSPPIFAVPGGVGGGRAELP